MRAMNEAQWKLVKFYLTELKIPPKVLVKKWNAYWQKTGSNMRIELHEVYRVLLTVAYEVYKNDDIADEDVMLAVEGIR